ncbi:MAG TPA: sensor domain-containing diguanylate cyclase [Pyrinomonadaceae bacterium]|nr:sensor domain-containing diguanylate cyclase [Pyrinomonadaceae bacterium]
MHSLYDVLLTQHARQLTPVRCAVSTIVQLHRYFEDVVLENNLGALIVESLPLAAKRPAREKARVRELARGGRRAFFFVRQADALSELVTGVGANSVLAPAILQQAERNQVDEHFVVIADARFSALLATVRGRAGDAAGGDEVIWTFEPDIVYSALEYLMARVGAEHPYHAVAFGSAVRTSMPKATSLQLTLSVTTKLAHLLQEQAGREIAVNRIATAIRESLELGVILQKTVDEVGTALNVASCALRVEGQTSEQALTYFHFAPNTEVTTPKEKIVGDLDAHCARFAEHPDVITQNGGDDPESSVETLPLAVVPLIFHERLIGALQVISADPGRVWQENEILLVSTVANQVAVAVNHANLFAQIQQQALTDALTGCYNRRSFEMQLDKDLMMARRTHQPVSLVMLDLDRFKQLNDTAGHDAGDAALRKLADCFRQEVRGVDSAARFGGDEFALILPRAYSEGALLVAERLRARIEQIEIPGFGSLTASMGIATFPTHARSREALTSASDAALYSAKRSGRNRVCIFEAMDGKSEEVTPGELLPPETVEQTKLPVNEPF